MTDAQRERLLAVLDEIKEDCECFRFALVALSDDFVLQALDDLKESFLAIEAIEREGI